MPSADELAILRALPLEVKIQKSKQRILEWLEREESAVSFSGGKDSTVLAHLVHQVDPNVPLVFSNTGLEYMEIQSFARKMGAEFIRPEMRFDEVISTYGYPVISKEVAEAIYYARRIRNGAEKTPERKRTEPQGNREWKDWRRACLCNAPQPSGSRRNGRRAANIVPIPKAFIIVRLEFMTAWTKMSTSAAIP